MFFFWRYNRDVVGRSCRANLCKVISRFDLLKILAHLVGEYCQLYTVSQLVFLWMDLGCSWQRSRLYREIGQIIVLRVVNNNFVSCK